MSTNTRTIRVTTVIQLNTATNSTAKKSPIRAAYKQSPTLTLHTPNTKLKPIKNHVSRAVTELRGFSSLWLFVWGVHVENFFSWLRLRILNAYRRDQKSFQPSTKTTFTHSHRKWADFWQKGQNPLYILIFYATFISPHYAGKYCVLLSKKNIDNIKMMLPIPVNLSWLRCQISGFYFH